MTARIAAAVALGLGLAWAGSAIAQDTIKIGLILPYSGPFADAANQLEAGIKLYMQSTATRSPARRSRSSARTPAARPRTSPSAWRRNWSCATVSTSWPASR